MLDEDQQTAFDLAKDGHNLVVIEQGGLVYDQSISGLHIVLYIIKPFIGFY
jgi:hypothetical protein